MKDNIIIADFVKMTKDNQGWYIDDNSNIPYLNPPFDKDWNLLIWAWYIFTTDRWNKGIDISYIFQDFSDCVARNAPKTASEILSNAIKNI